MGPDLRKQCPSCGALAPLDAPVCESTDCGHQFRTNFSHLTGQPPAPSPQPPEAPPITASGVPPSPPAPPQPLPPPPAPIAPYGSAPAPPFWPSGAAAAPPPGYGQSLPGAPAPYRSPYGPGQPLLSGLEAPKTDACAIVSLVFGGLSAGTVMCCLLWPITWGSAPLGLILGIVSLFRIKADRNLRGSGMAWTGIALSAIPILMMAVYLLISMIGAATTAP